MVFEVKQTYEQTNNSKGKGQEEIPEGIPEEVSTGKKGQDVSVGETSGGDAQGGDGGSGDYYERKETATKEEIVDYITTVFSLSGAGGVEWSLSVAACESGFNPFAYNPSGASGLFQFMPSTFLGNGGKDIWNWREQVNLAYGLYMEGKTYLWECSYNLGYEN